MANRLSLIVCTITLCLSILFVSGLLGGRSCAFEMHRTMQLRVDLGGVEKEKAAEFMSSGFDLVAVNPDASVEVIASTEEYERLISEGYPVTVSMPDLREHLMARDGRSTGLGRLGD